MGSGGSFRRRRPQTAHPESPLQTGKLVLGGHEQLAQELSAMGSCAEMRNQVSRTPLLSVNCSCGLKTPTYSCAHACTHSCVHRSPQRSPQPPLQPHCFYGCGLRECGFQTVTLPKPLSPGMSSRKAGLVSGGPHTWLCSEATGLASWAFLCPIHKAK